MSLKDLTNMNLSTQDLDTKTNSEYKSRCEVCMGQDELLILLSRAIMEVYGENQALKIQEQQLLSQLIDCLHSKKHNITSMVQPKGL